MFVFKGRMGYNETQVKDMEKRRIVIKVGSSTITHASGLLNLRKLDELARVLSDLRNAGHEVLLVSSGAIAAGRGKMHRERPQTLEEKQALAAIGQCELMYIYDKMFSQYSCSVAQLLITKEVIDDDVLRRNVRGTIETLLEYRSIPIINENDSVATDEIVYGDNDTLSAITARLISADLLILLSDVEGLYERNPADDPAAKQLDVVHEISEEIMAMAGDSGSELGTGGMITKLQAGRIATDAAATWSSPAAMTRASFMISSKEDHVEHCFWQRREPDERTE